MREGRGALPFRRTTDAAGAKRAQLYHQLPLANKARKVVNQARKAPQAKSMCANLTPF
jgi:hypothetical protein